ncbi:MAG: hypothetical protein O2912_07530 [Proteobacteria bacterium]|nr:hypothetical protein [Pseudomonadota bacterium]
MSLDEICERFKAVAAPLVVRGDLDQWLDAALGIKTLATVAPLMTLRTA